MKKLTLNKQTIALLGKEKFKIYGGVTAFCWNDFGHPDPTAWKTGALIGHGDPDPWKWTTKQLTLTGRIIITGHDDPDPWRA